MEELKKSRSDNINKIENENENENKIENENENENEIENILKNPTKIGNILLKYISSELKNCTWEKEGKEILNYKKLSFNIKEKRILKCLLKSDMDKNTRKILWMIGSGARKLMREEPSYYYNILNNYPKECYSPYVNQIDADLKRTFPNDPEFNENKSNIEKLRNVLIAYSRRNFTIGYCQGFNFIVGRLLKIIENEEETFWIFVQIIEEILPLNYFNDLIGVMVDCSVVENLFEIEEPVFHDFIMKLGFSHNLNNIINKWLISLFINSLDENLNLKIWDFLFLEGEIVIFKSCLAIIKGLFFKMKDKTNFEDAYIFMSSYKFEYNEYIWDILYYLIMKRFNFNIETIRLRREFFQKPIVMNLEYEMQMRNCLKKQRKLNTNYLIKTVKEENKCNRNFPICKEIKNFENKKKPLLEFWGISKKLSSLQDKNFIIEDYFFKKIKQRIRNSKKLSQYNKENFETTKKILENLNKSIELDSIKLSKSIDFGIDIDKDLDLSSFEENSKNKDENENEIIQINEVKIKSSVKLDKINLTNLQIININMQKSDFNLITNYDVIEKYENENSNNIDDLKIERHLHYCENEDLSISKSNSFCESENISVNENNNHNYNNQIDSLGISNNNNYDSIYIDNGNNLTEECKNIPNSSDDFNKRVRLDSIENSFDEWGSQKFTPSPKKMEMKLLK